MIMRPYCKTKRYITYEQYGKIIDELVKEIKYINRNINYVYGIPRGGLPIAVHLSHHLGIPWRTKQPKLSGIYPDQYMLIVDDIADTGETLSRYDKKQFLTATLFYKKQSFFQPDFYVETVKNDEWIVFPWEETIQKHWAKDGKICDVIEEQALKNINQL